MRMQTKEELELWYRKPDPWGYKSNPDDHYRRDAILDALRPFGQFTNALDIGCGEGFITKDLPAGKLYGIDISETAIKRLPPTVRGIDETFALTMPKFDLVITTGTLYWQYDHLKIAELVKKMAGRIVLVSGIKDWLVDYDFGEILSSRTFIYRQYEQKLTVYQVRNEAGA